MSARIRWKRLSCSLLAGIIVALATYWLEMDSSTNEYFPSSCRGLPICWFYSSTREKLMTQPVVVTEIIWLFLALDIAIWAFVSYILLTIVVRVKLHRP